MVTQFYSSDELSELTKKLWFICIILKLSGLLIIIIKTKINIIWLNLIRL